MLDPGGGVESWLRVVWLSGKTTVSEVVDGVLAQLVERLVRNEKVRSSSLLGSTILHPEYNGKPGRKLPSRSTKTPAIAFGISFAKKEIQTAMKSKSSPWKMILLVGLVTLVGYVMVFSWVENRRRKNGPWEFIFTQSDNSPALLVNHAKLGLTNIMIVFRDAIAPTNEPQTIQFKHGQVAPFDLPFGKCVFLDTLFLPGSVTCEMFGHEIQFLPRTMTIDRVERPWQTGEKILLTNQPSATLPAN
jgi:hypothetical protein